MKTVRSNCFYSKKACPVSDVHHMHSTSSMYRFPVFNIYLLIRNTNFWLHFHVIVSDSFRCSVTGILWHAIDMKQKWKVNQIDISIHFHIPTASFPPSHSHMFHAHIMYRHQMKLKSHLIKIQIQYTVRRPVISASTIHPSVYVSMSGNKSNCSFFRHNPLGHQQHSLRGSCRPATRSPVDFRYISNTFFLLSTNVCSFASLINHKLNNVFFSIFLSASLSALIPHFMHAEKDGVQATD